MDYHESLNEQEAYEERNLPEAEDDLLQARMLAQWLVAWVNDNHWTHFNDDDRKYLSQFRWLDLNRSWDCDDCTVDGFGPKVEGGA